LKDHFILPHQKKGKKGKIKGKKEQTTQTTNKTNKTINQKQKQKISSLHFIKTQFISL